MTKWASALLLVSVIGCSGHDGPVAPTQTSAVTTVPPPAAGATGCARTSTGMTPLTELRGMYSGQPGGLYPGGSNQVPSGHLAAGVALASAITPLNASGAPDANGRYVFLSIGMSNTTQEFSTFKPLADADAEKNPRLTIVDGAQGGVTASEWASPSCSCWTTADQRLAESRVSPGQVVAVWIKLANANPTQPFPVHADMLRDDIAATLANLKARYPNVRLAYLSSRIYAGYATSTLNPEPYAYESAFALRDLITRQISGDASLNFDASRGPVRAPWLAWGPYMWADGLRPRADGLTWSCGDFVSDGTHPSDAGRRKVADMLLSFVKTDSTARAWFVR
jgi:lysophospholipase L1-like esterase